MTTGTRQYLLLLYPPDARALMQALAKQLRAADLHVDLRPLPEPGDLPATMGEASEQGALVLLAVSAPLQETLAAALSSGMAAVPSGRWLVLQLDGTERLALPEAVVVLAWPRQAKGAAEKRIRQVTLDRIQELVGATPSRMQPAAADPAPVPGAMEARKKSGKANKKKDSNRDNFSKEIRLALSRRVGGFCSKPGCKNHTSGPHSESSKVTDTGVAAHITAAAPGGPRYNSKLTPEQRSSADNGIWLCQNHAKLIDSDAATYSEALLREWKAQAECEQQDRQNGIHASRSDWTWPGAYDFAPYRKERRQGFMGRRWLLARVRAWASDPEARQALLIGADFGVGKTAFLAQLLDQEAQIASALETPTATEIDPLQNTGPGLPVLAQHFCRWEENAYLSPGRFVQSLAAQLKEELPAYRKLLEADDASQRRDSLDQAEAEPLLAFQQGVVAPLARIPAPATQRLLVVDALDEALDYRPGAGGSTRFTIVDLLAKEACNLPPWLRLLATSRRRDEVLEPLRQGFFAIEEINAEEAANLSDIHDYVEARFGQEPLAAFLSAAGLSPSEVADVLQAKSGGKFLYAVRVLNDLASGALTLENRQTLDALPPGMDGFYEDTFRRRFPEAGDYDSVKPLLGLLCAQREPMGYQQLAAILQQSVDQIGRCLQPLEDLLRFRQPPEAEAAFSSSDDWRISFDHASLEQWLTERSGGKFPRARAGRFAVDPDTAKKQIHTWALAEVQAGRAHTWPYLVRHLASHLNDDERADVIGGQLLQFPWLQARLKLAGLTVLLGDFNPTQYKPNSLPPELTPLERALRQAAHVLSQEEGWNGQEQLASQLLARLSDGALPQGLEPQMRAGLHKAGGAAPRAASLAGNDALLRTLPVGSGVQAVVELPDGRLAAGCSDGRIRLWDPASRACSAVFEGHGGAVSALAVLADGRLASGSDGTTIRLWDLSTGDCDVLATDGRQCSKNSACALSSISRFASKDDQVTSLLGLPSGQLAIGCSHGTIDILDLSGNGCLDYIGRHDDPVLQLISLDDRRLASCSDAEIIVWDLDSVDFQMIPCGDDGWCVTSLLILGDQRLASGSADGVIRVWDLDSSECNLIMEARGECVTCLAEVRHGLIASGHDNGDICLWDVVSGACVASISAHQDRVSSIVPVGDAGFASGSLDQSIRIWNTAFLDLGDLSCMDSHGIASLKLLPNGLLASGCSDGLIRLLQPSSGECALQLEAHEASVESFALLFDDRLVSASADCTSRLWDLKTCVCAGVIEEDVPVICLATLADGRVASGTWGCSSITIWDSNRSQDYYELLEGHRGSVMALAVLTDGRLASGSSDNTIRLWDPASGDCSAVFEGHRREVIALAVLADGRLASGSGDNTIRLWDLASGDCSAVFQGHGDWVRALAVLADGRLASGSDDHTIRLWDPTHPDGAPRVLFVADAAITALAWVPSHQLLVAGDYSGRLHWLELGGLRH